MHKLTANISREEMACQCGCGFDTADYELVTVMQDSADFFMRRDGADKVMIIVKSGNRCQEYNEVIQKIWKKNYISLSSKSQHMKSASDYKLKTFVKGSWKFISSHELGQYLDSKYPNKYGIGTYQRGRVHLDIRPMRTRWPE